MTDDVKTLAERVGCPLSVAAAAIQLRQAMCTEGYEESLLVDARYVTPIPVKKIRWGTEGK